MPGPVQKAPAAGVPKKVPPTAGPPKRPASVKAPPPAHREAVLADWDPATITRVFQEIFAGERYCERFYGYRPRYVHAAGYIERDRPLVGREDLPRAYRRLVQALA